MSSIIILVNIWKNELNRKTIRISNRSVIKIGVEKSKNQFTTKANSTFKFKKYEKQKFKILKISLSIVFENVLKFF